MGDDRGSNAPPRVHIVDSHDTADAADEIIRGLDRLGVDASAPVPSGPGQLRAVVVLLSRGGLADSVWLRRVESLRDERLVPVLVGTVADSEVPDFLRELNWVFYGRGDHVFLARLFTGINTDASRFRDARDTRALAERWQASGRNPDFLIDDVREVKRRIEQESPSTTTTTTTTAGVAPVEFLAASRFHAERLRLRRIWRGTYRSALAIAAVGALVFTIGAVREAVRANNNAVSFAIGDSAGSGRPDLAAIKAGASLADSGDYPASDGRLRIAVDALSQHWPIGYLSVGGSGVAAGGISADGSFTAMGIGGSFWTWDEALDSPTQLSTGVPEILAGDISRSGDLALATDGVSLTVVKPGDDATPVGGIDGVQQLRLAPAHDAALVQSGNSIYAINAITSASPAPTSLGVWDSVLDIVQTSDGSAVALAVRDDLLTLVRDDGSTVMVGSAPEGTTTGSLAADGSSFALVADDVLWSSAGGPAVSTGVVVPGTVLALQLISDGVALVSDRTRGTWAADLGLGLDLGAICQGLPRTTGFVSGESTDRILCLQGALIAVDSLGDIRPAAVKSLAVVARTTVESSSPSARVKSVSIIDGLIRIDRADGMSFALDAAGLSFEPGFVRPAWVDDMAFFGTGALIQAESLPTSVALTLDGSTFAIGFIDGRLIEVDLSEAYSMATVGSWQMPDHSAVTEIDWSADTTSISATTETGTIWQRPSCAGCWGALTITQHIIDRVWLCYAEGDIAELGDTARQTFALRSCESRWGAAA